MVLSTFRPALKWAAVAIPVAISLLVGPAVSAAPKPSEKELKSQLSSLEKKVDKLITDYHAAREDLAKARKSEKAARGRLKTAQTEYAAAEREVARFAAMSYQTAPDPAVMFLPPDIASTMVVAQLQVEKAAAFANFAKKQAERKLAGDDAKKLIAEIKSKSKDIGDQREDAEKLIGQIKDKLDQLIPIAPGRLSNGGWAPELPTGADNITPRTRLIRAEIRDKFRLSHTVGCWRVDNSGEHPLGRACDFMMSTGGSMPSAANKALGDQISAWALKNKSKLGVKYVIWRQQINTGSGWRGMSNRGGITANHFDHVHISMY